MKWLARQLILLALWLDSDLTKSVGSGDHGFANDSPLGQLLIDRDRQIRSWARNWLYSNH
ncbi:MAG: hypothetical protein NTY30_01765 [Candidatus Berkelbacteria bacterium]|nr:hypothetical protein [Candidatus Berkelbacteria bacterium]